MKTIPEAFQQHLDGDVITLCRCWIIETNEGNRLGFSDHDEDIEIEGVLCHKETGVESGAIEERTGLNVNSSDVSGALQSDYITSQDIERGTYDNARVTTYLVNWNDPTQYALDRVSLVGEITQEDNFYKMELRGLISQLDQTKGNHFVARCQASLGDSRCKVQLDTPDFQANASVSSVSSRLVIQVNGLDGFPSNWFRGGFLTWSSGANSGLQIEIAEHQKQPEFTVLHLWQAMPERVEPTDLFTIVAGCDKSFSVCKTKFQNHLNFRGFPHIPGNDESLTIASKGGVFDGAPLVP